MPKSLPERMPESVRSEVPGASADFRTELAAQLAELVPEAVADGRIDTKKLAELLGDDAADDSERFGLFWPGKKRALRAAQAPTTATLKPDFDNSKEWDTTQNVFIEGDNLEVLKILQRHYHNKIKLIYIDPPYNTGKDFVYPDNFTEGLDTYLEWTRQVNEEGRKVSTNPETAGRFHSNWLNMMYPRLKLARNLLKDDGVIFISIDDNEVDNLTRLCKEVFGESNFSTTFIRQKKKKPSFLHENVGSMTEYAVCLTRNKSFTFPFSVDVTTAGKKFPLNNAGNSLGILHFPAGSVSFRMADAIVDPQDMSEGNIVTRLLDTLVIKNGKNKDAFRLEGEWRYSQETLDEIVSNRDSITISKIPFRPNHVKTGGEIKKMHNLLTPETYGAGTNEDGTEEVTQLLGGDYFDNPKPTSLIKLLVQATTYGDPEAIVLDFFAGSSTTAHAVMQLNAEDGGNRRFIMVQLPEPTPADSEARKAGFDTIADISRKRIKLAGEKIGKGDTGFRAYKLADTHFAKWRVSSEVTPTQLEQHLLDLRESADDAASQDDLLTELLLKLGLSLSERITTKTIAGLEVREVGDNRLLACVDEHSKPTLEQLRALVDAAPEKLVVLEDAFHGDDQLKTNLAQYATTKGVELRTA